MNWPYLIAGLCGLLVGAVLGAQSGVNGTLAKYVGHPLQASVISFTTGLSILLVVSLLFRVFPPKLTVPLAETPWWSWTGGAIGAIVVTCSLIFAPRTGALNWIALIVCGQVFSSMIFDHFGWVGFPIHTIHPMRIVGAALLIAGLVIVSRW